MKIGRNQPCPCNSGLKYKKCCINKVNAEKSQAIQKRNQTVKDEEEMEYKAKRAVEKIFENLFSTVKEPPSIIVIPKSHKTLDNH